jgi:DNA mismatch repair protein MutS
MSLSILFKDGVSFPASDIAEPDFFADVNLDQIVTAITAGKEEYYLGPFFRTPLHDVDAVRFRHEVMQDLKNGTLFDNLIAFASAMRAMRSYLAELDKRYYEHQNERWFLDAVDEYADAVIRLSRDLSAAPLASRALRRFNEYIAEYAAGEPFQSLAAKAKSLKAQLNALRYTVLINGARVKVRSYAGEGDYTAEVIETFERFKQGDAKSFEFRFADSPEMNHIESQILDGVVQLNGNVFEPLNSFRTENQDFADRQILSFDREIQFYLSYLSFIAKFEEAGLFFCYPAVSVSRKDVYDYRCFDLALANKLLGQGATPVCNDFYLRGPERIIVVSGPNQGGKTTFARTFAQLHFLASLGCPVPGSRAQLYLADRIFTHFERQEWMTSLRGKLEDDLVRIHQILEAATSRSIIVINEIFASTALADAVVLSKEIADALMAFGALGVWVTFIDEVARLDQSIVSMVSTVVADNPAQRTFKIVRQPADGLAYAMSIAEKYQLTYAAIRGRVGS